MLGCKALMGGRDGSDLLIKVASDGFIVSAYSPARQSPFLATSTSELYYVVLFSSFDCSCNRDF